MLAAGLSAQDAGNPFTGARDIEQGKRHYRFYCVNCHGMNGDTGRGARLTSKIRRHGTTDAEMFRTILNGVPGTEMPALRREEEVVWKILAYVRTIEASAGAADSCEATGGDPQRGRVVFEGKGGCLACHTAGARGGQMGPDLSYAGTRSPAFLRESLLDPSKEVAPAFAGVRVVANGRTVEGVRLNEDEYTVHLLDAGGRIHSFRRAEASKVERLGKSLMPAYDKTLAAAEIADVVAYLCSLGGGK